MKVGDKTYSVHVEKELYEKGQRMYGLQSYHEEFIKVDADTPKKEMARVLLHETFHCLFDAAGMDNFPDIAKNEELIVDLLSRSLATVLNDNPEFIKYLGEVYNAN